ncbi:MAG: CPBP family intramembrane metalloprotease [Acidobacteria bacterium]|nr:CPBP family intramembrane metalloprotease [Acidobacteriota bacterium]
MIVEEIGESNPLPDAAQGERPQANLQGMFGEKMLAAWEIASVTLSFLIAAWVVPPFARQSLLIGAIPLCLALALMLLSQRARGESARDIGWRMDNFISALISLALPMLAFAALIIIVGWLSNGFRTDKVYVWQWLAWLPAWALIQQYALQGFINRRAQILCGRGLGSILLVACIFAVLHLPNPWLACATFVGGLIWGSVYQRHPNLPALAISHTLMSLVLVWALPPSMMSNLRVGFRYFG